MSQIHKSFDAASRDRRGLARADAERRGYVDVSMRNPDDVQRRPVDEE